MLQNAWQSFASQIATNDDDHRTVEFLNRKPAVVLMAGLFSLLCGTGNVGKICLHAGSTKFTAQNEGCEG